MKRRYGAMLACIGTGFGQAFAAVPDPADANTVIPPTIYRSPFADYRPLGEDKNTPWKDANDTVGKIGGWRVYAREAADAMKVREAADTGSAKPQTAPPSPATVPTPVPTAPAVQSHKHGG